MTQRNWISLALGATCLFTWPAQTAERNPRIQQAIDRGVAFLRTQQDKNGVWAYQATYSPTGGGLGATALVGLTLLECGVPPDDPAVQQVAKYIRKNAAALDFTYALSTSIWFLDRLGDDGDVPLIQLFAVRLMAGQNEFGGWTYTCPPIGGGEERQLLNRIQPRLEGRVDGVAPPKKDPAAKPDPEKEKKRELAPEIKGLLKRLDRPAPPAPPPLGGEPVYQQDQRVAGTKGDNSNTQFASLALWVSRRYGLPVEPNLATIEQRFRVTQLQDGG
jgi:hypothetical protein